ncbi:unnamed protein product, partial [Didymodactylos carnosus]
MFNPEDPEVSPREVNDPPEETDLSAREPDVFREEHD